LKHLTEDNNTTKRSILRFLKKNQEQTAIMDQLIATDFSKRYGAEQA